MTELTLYIGKNCNGYKVGYFTGLPAPLDRVVDSVSKPKHFRNIGEYLAGRGVTRVNIIPALQNPRIVRENLADKLLNVEDQNQAKVFIGSLKIVDEQMKLFGKNHELKGIPDERVKRIYKLVKGAMAS